MNTYNISRYEEQGDSLFICIVSKNNPVYLEHFFTAEEKLDKSGTIERLVAELELLDDAYVAPIPVVSKLSEIPAISIENIASRKNVILADRAAKIEADRLAAIGNVPVEPMEPTEG